MALALLVAQLCFATLAVEAKLAMSAEYGVSPLALAMARVTGGAVPFVVAHVAMGTPRVRAWRDVVRLTVLALFGIVLNQLFFLSGLRRTTPISATLLVATIPVFTVAVAALFGRERLRVRTACGIGVALLGMATLTRFALPRAGDLLVILNSLSYAIYVVFAKEVLLRYGATTVMAWIFGLGALLFAPLGATALIREAGRWSDGAVALVAFVVLVPTLLAYGLNAWALRRAPPSLVTIFIYLQPLVVALLAWLQLGYPIDGHTLAAGLLILTGVGIAATRRIPSVSSSGGAVSPSAGSRTPR